MEKEYFPVVVQAVAGPGRIVYAYFSNGQVKRYDMSSTIERGGVFAPLADETFFTERLTRSSPASAASTVWTTAGTLPSPARSTLPWAGNTG